jgi:Flp pilus assembly protein TadG
MGMKLSRMHREERAQGVIEFAVIAMILMFTFLGTVDFARFMYRDFRDASREKCADREVLA